MSHFTVLVVGDDHEAALQPFHEFECTGDNDQYVQDVDVTDETLARLAEGIKTGQSNQEALDDALGYYGLDDKVVDDESKVDRNDEHKYGFAIVKNGDLVKAVNRTNPDKKWDWYQVGGRWQGTLKLKAGAEGDIGEPSLLNRGHTFEEGRCDQARVGDVDWDGMIAEAGAKAGELFDKVIAAVAGRPVTHWSEFLRRNKAGELSIEQARDAYNEQPVVKDVLQGEGPLVSFWMDGAQVLEDILTATSCEDYVRYEGMDNSRAYALLHNGEWIEPGRMGWWGMSSETPDSKRAYTERYWQIVRSLPEDAMVTMVDCHI